MEPRVSYALVGLFIIVLTTALVGIGLWLTTGWNEGDYRRYSIYMSESAFGLGADSSVVYYGVGVGRVVDVRLTGREDKSVKAIIQIDTDEPLREGTVASLKMRGVTGIAYVELAGGAFDGAPLRTPPGEPYPVIPYEPSLIMRLDQAVTEGMDTLEDIGGRIDALLSPDNMDRIEATLTNLQTLTSDLTKTSRRMRRSMDQVDRSLAAGGRAAEEAGRAFARAETVLGDISAAAASVEEAARSVEHFSQEGQVVAKDVTRDTLPQIRALSAELRATARSLQRLSESLQRDPGQLLYGPSRERGERSQ
ncbi:MCE family protein [Ectothiorhodospiraceae bacterium WFHF3C12]|nr:MCE family protein [Ectothiorhodospiraceae bacterium WFHF3C12]